MSFQCGILRSASLTHQYTGKPGFNLERGNFPIESGDRSLQISWAIRSAGRGVGACTGLRAAMTYFSRSPEVQLRLLWLSVNITLSVSLSLSLSRNR